MKYIIFYAEINKYTHNLRTHFLGTICPFFLWHCLAYYSIPPTYEHTFWKQFDPFSCGTVYLAYYSILPTYEHTVWEQSEILKVGLADDTMFSLHF